MEKQPLAQSSAGSSSTRPKLRKRRWASCDDQDTVTEFVTSSSEHSVQKQPPAQSAAGSSSTKPKLRKRRWTAEELHILFTAFGRDITEKSMPCGTRIADLVRKLPDRTVAQIRVQVNNFITGKVAMSSL